MCFWTVISSIFRPCDYQARVAVDQAKVRCIHEWPKPTTFKGLRGFLGLAGYYCRFVKNFGAIARPLIYLLNKNGFKWTLAAEQVFARLKLALTSIPLIALPNFSKPFVLESDAYDGGIGVVLSQESHPIAYLSCILAPKHMAIHVYDKELMVIVYAMQQWRHYLMSPSLQIIKQSNIY